MAATPTSISSVARLRGYVAAIVVSHTAAVVWHLFVVIKMHPAAATAGFLLWLGGINLLPFIALALLGTRFRPVAGWLLLVPFGLALIVGLFAHFVSAGPDNIFQMAPGPWALSFAVSAVLLVVLEVIGSGLAITVLRRH